MANSPHTNRLIESTSPYLLQHAHNPVDWWPWGQQAFEEARRRDVPIFLSIGYSTCYWCHVMERESFESTRVAALLNQHFVCIKVDREERPDVDDIYMAATLISNGHGGWPMSLFLEPQRLRPFYCGTYFPAEPRPNLGSMPTLPQLVEGLSNAWIHKREEVMQAADSLADAVSEELTRRHEPVALNALVVEKAVAALLSVFDRSHGGFGGKPKFPQAVNLEFLFTVREHTQDQTTRAAIDHALRLTIDRMACGGIFDQIGGGFHRYAVDQIWLVPHFEKMLYDNAQLLPLYAMAAVTYANPDDERIARLIVSYLDREMTAPDGAFYSAQDAEVDGREGKNYLWTPKQAREALGENAEAAISIYGLDGHPNFRDPHHPDEPASHVLHLEDMPTRLADRAGVNREEWLVQLTAINAALLEVRDRRKQPRLDDKVLASWNGLMISGLARAAEYLKDTELLKRAQRAALAVRNRLIESNGVLLRCSRDGKAHTPGFLEDYAMVVQGLTSIVRAARALEHDASQELKLAVDLATQADSLFSAPDGGFFDVSEEQTDLFVRPRTTYDGALPTGQSVLLHAMLDLAEFTDDSRWLERSMSHLRALSGQISAGSVASINSTRALLRVLVDPENAARASQFGPIDAQPQETNQEQGIGFTPVEVYADRDSIDVGPGLPGEIWLELQIAPGFHIVAAEPGDAEIAASLIPLRVFLLAGDGLSVYADYPPGESYTDDGLMVYRDAVTIRVAVEHSGASTGNPVLGVQFQACDEMSCQLPTTVELDVAINMVRSKDS